MKPLPAQTPGVFKANDPAMPTLPSVLAAPTASYSTSNRRASALPGQRVYPWLLAASTALAAGFCFLYVTKPVIVAPPGVTAGVGVAPAVVQPVAAAQVNQGLMPSQDRLPGEKSAGRPGPAAAHEARPQSRSGAFEQTNIRIQHILSAEAPGGHLAKIDLDVPVLYQSRNLRWTAAEVAGARDLLVRLADYQEKSRTLRMEGSELLDAWNHLIARSIPTGELRADSPTLPTNQQDAADAPRPAGLDTTEAIKIQPAGK
jgi:hypothetical protein